MPEVSLRENGNTELEGGDSAGIYPDLSHWLLRLGTEQNNNSSSPHPTGLHLCQTDQLADNPGDKTRGDLHLSLQQP